MRIIRENTLALAIDIQTKLFPFIFGNEIIEANTLRLIAGIKALKLPVLVTEQYSKGIGPTINSVIDALGNDYQPIEKMSFSCCGNEKFINKLNKTGKKNIIVFGIESHVCVLQTVIDLANSGFQPIVIEDCISSRKLSDKQTAVERMRQEGAIVSSYESILFELLVESGTEDFKAISKIIR